MMGPLGGPVGDISEPFSTSSALVFEGLKDADRGDDRCGSTWAAAEFGQ